MKPDTREHQRAGMALVLLQLTLLTLLAATAWPSFVHLLAPASSRMLVASGVALGIGSLAANRPGNFNISPAPRAGGTLVLHGPYRWIRHPMYSALIVVGLGAAAAVNTAWTWGWLIGLTVTLTIKAHFEERWMAQTHPGYAAYQVRTRRFLPGVF